MDISYDSVENAACSDLEASYYGISRRYFMPYLDHCYATGLPTIQFDSRPDSPPLPLTEPLAAFVDIEEVGMRGASHHPHSSLGVISSGTSTITNKRMAGNNYGSIKNNSSNNNSGNVATGGNSGGGDAEVDPYEGSVTRCICDFQHDDGYMICCDRCGVWQHVECMGVDGKHIPDSYLCELCYPRIVDKRRAVRIQSKKKEELEMEDSSASADDSLEDESKRPKKRGGRKKEQGRRKSTTDSSGGGQSHKKSQQQQRRKRSSSEMDGKKNFDGSFHSLHKGTDQKRSRPQSYTGSSTSAIDSLDTWGLNSTHQRSASGSHHSAPSGVPIQPNTYSSEVINLLMMKVKTMGSANNSNVMAIAQQLSRKCFKVVTYEGSSKGLEAVETIKPNHTVAEYTGKTVMRREYERNCQSDLSYPFTVCYMGINGVELCVDSTEFSNEAKFVRRSCTPNAKVVHLLEKTGLRFFICATKTIPSGKEITIPFYFDYHRSSVEVKCPCGKSSCMVAKHFKRSSGRSIASATATTGLNSTSTTAANVIATAAASLRPVRQSKKRVLEEFMDNGADEDEDDGGGGKEEEEGSQFFSRDCSESIPSARVLQQQFTKKKCGTELLPQSVVDQQRETKTPTTFSGRIIKMPRGRHAPQISPSNNNSSGNKSPSLTSSRHAHLDLAKTSLEPISTNVGDDIALFNKLSSVDAIQHAENSEVKSKINENEKLSETVKSQHDQKSMPSKNLRERDESQASSATGASRRKQLMVSQAKEGKATEERKEQHLQNNGKMSDSGDKSDSGTDNKPAPKEKRKNSKLLAEIQTFLKSDTLEEDKESGGKKVSTREQRKIEAAERRFEKIEKTTAKVNSKSTTTSTTTSSTASPNSKSMRTRSVQQQDDKDKAAEMKKSGSKTSASAVRASKSVVNAKALGGKSKQEEATAATSGRPGRPPSSKKTVVADTKINKTALLPARSGRPTRK